MLSYRGQQKDQLQSLLGSSLLDPNSLRRVSGLAIAALDMSSCHHVILVPMVVGTCVTRAWRRDLPVEFLESMKVSSLLASKEHYTIWLPPTHERLVDSRPEASDHRYVGIPNSAGSSLRRQNKSPLVGRHFLKLELGIQGLRRELMHQPLCADVRPLSSHNGLP